MAWLIGRYSPTSPVVAIMSLFMWIGEALHGFYQEEHVPEHMLADTQTLQPGEDPQRIFAAFNYEYQLHVAAFEGHRHDIFSSAPSLDPGVARWMALVQASPVILTNHVQDIPRELLVHAEDVVPEVDIEELRVNRRVPLPLAQRYAPGQEWGVLNARRDLL